VQIVNGVSARIIHNSVKNAELSMRKSERRRHTLNAGEKPQNTIAMQ
jgi:hypothetical protein